MTHICVSKLTIIGSDNGLSPGRRQAIIWTNDGILLIEPLRTNFSEILIAIQIFSFTKMRLKMWSVKWRPFCLGLNVLSHNNTDADNEAMVLPEFGPTWLGQPSLVGSYHLSGTQFWRYLSIRETKPDFLFCDQHSNQHSTTRTYQLLIVLQLIQKRNLHIFFRFCSHHNKNIQCNLAIQYNEWVKNN